MKKVAALTVCICFLLCSYRIDVSAMDKSEFILRTSETIENPFTGDFYTYLQTCVFPETDHGYINEMLDSLSSGFDFSVLDNYDYYYVMAERGGESNGVTTWWLDIYMFNSTKEPFIVYTNPALSPKFKVYGSYVNNNATVARCKYVGVTPTSSNSWYDESFSITEQYFYPSGSGNGYSYQHYSYSFYLMDTNLPVYILPEITSLSGYENDQRYSWVTDPSNRAQLTNLFPSSLEGYNATGSIVSGDGSGSSAVESNANHMYFKNCDIGFCYPMGSTTPASFGGAYFYIKYELDDWIVDHISEYTLDFYAECEVGSDTIVSRRISVPLEPDGCVVFPFSNTFISSLNTKGFSVLVTDNVIEDGFYKCFLYSIASSEFSNFGAKVSTYSGNNDLFSALQALAKGDIVSFLFYTYDSDVTIYVNSSAIQQINARKYNPFVIDAFTLLVSGNDQSGLVQKQFNLVTGSSVFTDTTGMQNQDPYDPPDSSDDTYLPSVPDGNNTTTPQVIINNGGTWSGSMNALITYDPAYRQLKEDLAADPNGNFTQYLAPFANNNAGGFVMGFLEGMPTALKTIFISGFGVLTLLGIYRFIRRG